MVVMILALTGAETVGTALMIGAMAVILLGLRAFVRWLGDGSDPHDQDG